MLSIIYKWQSLIGSAIGAMSPFMLWWFTNLIKNNNRYNDNLYYIEKAILDQVNNLIEIEKVIVNFKDNNINILIKNIKSNPTNSYSIDTAFFPLFSTLTLHEDIRKINTHSGYIDNKIGKVYQQSKDFPHIINDLRNQFEAMMQTNKELALSNKNSPEIQKRQYISNIEYYVIMLEKDQLDKSIPAYLESMIQTVVAVSELRKIGLWRWKLKYDPMFHFFINYKDYSKAQENTYINIEKSFKKDATTKMKIIEKIMKKSL